MFSKNKKEPGKSGMGMSSKLILAISVIVTILLVTSIIAALELRRVSNFVSEKISDNITEINLSTEFSVVTDEYNMKILSIVGNADDIVVSGLDPTPYLKAADNLLSEMSHIPGVGPLRESYERFKAESFLLDTVIRSDFKDTREWYFSSLEPEFTQMKTLQDEMNRNIQQNLQQNSGSFDEAFYRGIAPTIVSLGVAILLSLLLLFFVLVYYVRPLRKMIKALGAFTHFSFPYNVSFEGDDQLQELNGYIKDTVDENLILKKRIKERES